MKTSKLINYVAILLIYLLVGKLTAQVNYENGRMVINGIQLLQDSNDSDSYYYMPDYPRLALKEDGDFELLCMKYIGQGGNASGGLFHALIQFDLPEEVTAVFCGTKKTLAAGIPMAKVIFVGDPRLGMLLLPIMLYHPIQLFYCAMLANRYVKQKEENEKLAASNQ